MKRSHSLRFEALEGRQLLSTSRLALADHPHVTRALAGPIVLDGTLLVNNNPNAVITTTNADGSSTTATQVSGQLTSMGHVRGIWSESVDTYGNYSGPDTLLLRNPKGSILIAFNNQNPTRAAAHVPDGATYEHPQRVFGGSRAYAGASETGTIVLTTNRARAAVVSLTLQTATT
jgi:hypothetical protein